MAEELAEDRGAGNAFSDGWVPPYPGRGVDAGLRHRDQPQARQQDGRVCSRDRRAVQGPRRGDRHPKGELATIVKKLQADKVVGFIATTE